MVDNGVSREFVGVVRIHASVVSGAPEIRLYNSIVLRLLCYNKYLAGVGTGVVHQSVSVVVVRQSCGVGESVVSRSSALVSRRLLSSVFSENF